ncbi:nitrate reductase cytochrome c-type subunit [uncultured Alsobacter sp.]|uniref:nitrate reductase cytochrome c-type subunit n=1 Tax=uncultured Alsobacter sp. TaxID=1748258 RepID=UPI0025F5528E|nr:nitrate reductase cytochrome c-type subunit [uncultured Alsobacter sp.]
MRSRSLLAAVALAMAVALAGLLPGEAQDKSAAVKPLRELPLAEEAAPPDITRQSVPAGGFERAYRQQPPLIPHKVEGYQVSVDNNACMSCHDWPGNTKVGAPKISETHYVDRQGVRLDKVAGTRYFCQQCHVPQADAKPLVSNVFQNATQAK